MVENDFASCKVGEWLHNQGELNMVEFDQETMDSFVIEFREQIEEITRCVLLLENNPHDTESVHDLFRNLHNMKGNASVLEFEKISCLSHEAETLLDSIREQTVQINSDIIETLLTTADTLTALIDEIEGKGSFGQSKLNDLVNTISSYLPCDMPLKGKEARVGTERKRHAIGDSQAPILFVDDEPTAHKIVKKYLEDWNVKYAFSAEDALGTLEQEDIQVVITDINMPGMDGVDLLREVKRRHGAVQVIMATASEQLEDLTDALEAGANDFLLKPLEKGDIEEALHNTFSKINRWKTKMKTLFERRKQN